MSNELMLDVGQANELKMAFRRTGFTNADIKSLCENDGLLTAVRNNLRGLVINCDLDPFVPEGDWTVVRHERSGFFTWDGRLEFYLSKVQMSGKWIEGNEVYKELIDKKKVVLNANVLDFLLKNQHEIPVEWRISKFGNRQRIHFCGTVYSSGGSQCVRGLEWTGRNWRSVVTPLRADWGCDDAAAVRASRP